MIVRISDDRFLSSHLRERDKQAQDRFDTDFLRIPIEQIVEILCVYSIHTHTHTRIIE